MATPRPAVARPSPTEFFKLVSSPNVKIYVGDRAEPYEMPVELLKYYSPYFAACFRPGAFQEGIEGVLRWPNEKPIYFEVIMEYMRGYVDPYGTFRELAGNNIEVCTEYVKFCDRYDICEAVSVIAAYLPRNPIAMTKSLLRLCIERLHPDNPTMKAICFFLADELLHEKNSVHAKELVLINDRTTLIVMKEFLDITVAAHGRRVRQGDGPFLSRSEVGTGAWGSDDDSLDGSTWRA